MGGLPDLPAGKRWPAWRTRHLAGCACCLRRKGEPFPARASFVCQIDCADVAALDPEGLLPDAGTLLLFSEGRWTAPPRNLGWKVLYAPPGAELVRRTRPPDDGYPVFRPCALTFEQDWTCPGPLALPLLNASLDDRQYELLSTFEQEDDHSRMLGQPAMVQGPDVDCRVQVAAERLGVQGLRCDRAGYAALSPSIRARLEAEAREWRLLFQIESEGAAGMNWIDGGRLYVFVRADDLAARRFDRCRFTMQTH